MKRIKVLLLAAVGALALMAAAGASVASAGVITAAEYPATLKGMETEAHKLSLSGGRTFACTFSGLDATLPGASQTLTATVTPTGCSNEYEGNATVKMNGCKFIFHPGTTSSSFDIGPAGCGPITIEGKNCTRAFPAQTGLAASFENVAGSPSTVKISENASLQYTITKGGLVACGPSGTQIANLSGGWLVKAFNAGGSQINTKVASIGVFMTGKESGEEASQPKFAAETYPVALTAPQDPASKQVLTMGGNRKLKCTSVTAQSELTGASALLPLDVAYSGCVVEVLEKQFQAVVRVNDCNYVLHALNKGPAYSGSFDIACAEPTEAVEIDVYATPTEHICTYKFFPQTGRESVGLSTVGSGTESGVAVSYGLSGLSFTRAKGTLAACGGATGTATYTGTTTLRPTS